MKEKEKKLWSFNCERNDQNSFVQSGFSQTEKLTKSPVEYWFIETETQVFIQKNEG